MLVYEIVFIIIVKTENSVILGIHVFPLIIHIQKEIKQRYIGHIILNFFVFIVNPYFDINEFVT